MEAMSHEAQWFTVKDGDVPVRNKLPEAKLFEYD